MFWRVHAILAFTTRDEAHDFYHDCQVALPKAHTINPGQPNQERGHIIWEECTHDEEPTVPCTLLDQDYTPVS